MIKTFRLPRWLAAALQEALRKEKITQSEWFRQVAREVVNKHGIIS